MESTGSDVHSNSFAHLGGLVVWLHGDVNECRRTANELRTHLRRAGHVSVVLDYEGATRTPIVLQPAPPDACDEALVHIGTSLANQGVVVLMAGASSSVRRALSAKLGERVLAVVIGDRSAHTDPAAARAACDQRGPHTNETLDGQLPPSLAGWVLDEVARLL